MNWTTITREIDGEYHVFCAHGLDYCHRCPFDSREMNAEAAERALAAKLNKQRIASSAEERAAGCINPDCATTRWDGCSVRLHSLSLASLNGAEGVASAFDEPLGRVPVRLTSPPEARAAHPSGVNVRPQNLERVTQPAAGKLKKCANCWARYCSKECQQHHWKAHAAECANRTPSFFAPCRAHMRSRGAGKCSSCKTILSFPTGTKLRQWEEGAATDHVARVLAFNPPPGARRGMIDPDQAFYTLESIPGGRGSFDEPCEYAHDTDSWRVEL